MSQSDFEVEHLCESCFYFNPYNSSITGGECRLNPPQIFWIDPVFEYRWPVVNDEEWCGQWKQG